MKKLLLLTMLVMFFIKALPQNNYPVVGVSDERMQVYGLTNARVVVDYNHVLEDADLLIVKGKIVSIRSTVLLIECTLDFFHAHI